MAAEVAYIENSNTVELAGLNRKGEVITDARVTLILRTAEGVDIAGPTMMLHAGGGTYTGGFSHTAGLISGRKYICVIDANFGDDFAHWEMPVTAQTRKK